MLKFLNYSNFKVCTLALRCQPCSSPRWVLMNNMELLPWRKYRRGRCTGQWWADNVPPPFPMPTLVQKSAVPLGGPRGRGWWGLARNQKITIKKTVPSIPSLHFAKFQDSILHYQGNMVWVLRKYWLSHIIAIRSCVVFLKIEVLRSKKPFIKEALVVGPHMFIMLIFGANETVRQKLVKWFPLAMKRLVQVVTTWFIYISSSRMNDWFSPWLLTNTSIMVVLEIPRFCLHFFCLGVLLLKVWLTCLLRKQNWLEDYHLQTSA